MPHQVTIKDVEALPVGGSLIYHTGARYQGCRKLQRHLLTLAGYSRLDKRPGENCPDWMLEPFQRPELELKQALVKRSHARGTGIFQYILTRIAPAPAS